MELISIILIAIGLSMDSFAVSISNGLRLQNLKLSKSVLIAFSLAFFQAMIPLLGWLAGNGIEEYIQEIDHWVAFILLAFIGGKMLYDGFQKGEDSTTTELSGLTLIGQSIATSIDAFAVGISFAVLDYEITLPIIIIGLVTFLFSMLGLQLGKLFGKKLGKSVEIFGGLILIGIGIKILIEHIYLA
jgi:putative Mn2+ efflux pump MntP